MGVFPSSIRQKITLGYYAAVAVIIAVSFFTLLDLWYIERKVRFGEVVSELFDTTLEIRRYEKNFFLYEHREDLDENLRYVDKAQELLAVHADEYRSLGVAPRLDGLQVQLKAYRAVMEEFSRSSRRDTSTWEKRGSAVRDKGREIITVAEEVSTLERRRLETILTATQRVLLASILVLSLIGIGIGQFLSRLVVRPLKELQASMERIAAGGHERISINSTDREMASLTTAFNTMLRELEVRQQHLLQSEKLASVGTLMAGIAHEINNPLSNISTSCQILQEELDEGDREFQKELLVQIEEQTDRARNIVRSLLDFSREKEFKKEHLPLRQLVEETLKFIKGHIPPKVAVRFDVPDDIVIVADKQRIQQAFLNLFKNAVDVLRDEGTLFVRAVRHYHTPSTEVEQPSLYVFLKNDDRCETEGESVDIEIRDTGPGIPLEVLPRIFDPFFTTKDVGKGTGLGLAIVHEIINEHGGCIAVDTRPGEGTAFLIRLPLKE